MESLLPLIIQLVSGAVGGNVAGMAMKDKSLGTLGNTIAGLVGGGVGGQIINLLLGLGGDGGAIDIGTIISQIASGGVGGGVMLLIVGAIKGMMNK